MKHTTDSTGCQYCDHRLTSVLCKARSEYIDAFNDQKISNQYKKGQLIFSEGTYPFGVYCINSGKIKLSHLGDDGKEQITRLLRGGDVLGYRALLSGDRYSASAVALEDTQVCFIPKDLFVKALKNDPALSFEMMKLLSQELHKAELKITHLAQKPVRERLAETLLFIKETYGFEEDGITLSVKLSREEIANLVGTATESTIRLLSEFKKDGIIDLDGKKIKLMKPAALLTIANLQD
ncbi:CRP/FNR family transcriptional regulator, anaerobic regulatory protein [Filimonas lacunae]|uniref:CRP/FNR family transcriptional regulator, anaerobic regulatory protein n=1 Tax=Filimonas lacunae TaxID=477680 RepID=A0A173MP46_9BACT|nr:Crp/Fnr family transcriptional regulator [Filimonas lacunae]BAV09239.1 transcriptional regulator, Crp/Fnr family [Filimonas lacunae]SIS69555.1 CRP/FNR family transcriptional regulator, anaerobic regulatory protein [Filimonas lacunae]